jgi:hypothetical protein
MSQASWYRKNEGKKDRLMTVVGNSDIQQALKAAAADIKESVAKHGNVHPVVLQKLEAYIELLQQAAANEAEVAKWQERAAAMRKLIAQQQPKVEPPKVEASKVEAPPQEPPPVEAPKPAPKPPQPQPAEDGVFSLDDSEEEVSDEALEASIARAKEYVAPPVSETPAPDVSSDEAIMLYRSSGEHVAVAYKGYLYDPEGRNLGRYQDDFACFVDRGGHYLGEIYDGNRLIKDHNFRYSHFNFGDKGNEGDRAGWGRTPDIERTLLPPHLEDVLLKEE